MIVQKTDKISGVVLAGGDNNRFGGKNKANIVIDGERIITRIINTLEQIFQEVIIVTNSRGEFDQLSGIKITGDHFMNLGPLCGIHAAMKISSKEAVFIFAGDMPFLDKEIINNQIAFYSDHPDDVIVPRIDGNIEPLHAIYCNALSIELEEYFLTKKDLAIRNFLTKVSVSYMDINDSENVKRAFTNINTPTEAERANKRTGI
jgi:molybdopterin-guanine dinucleotide biosynthesis protein A